MPDEPTTAQHIMKVNVKSVASTMSLPDLEESLLQENVSGFPVVDDGKLVGVVSRSDIVAQLCSERSVAQEVSDFYFDERGFYEVPMESSQQIADRIGERIESLTVANVMSDRPFSVRHDSPIREVADLFIKHGVHRLPVTDHGQLIGVISTTDLVRLIASGQFVEK